MSGAGKSFGEVPPPPPPPSADLSSQERRTRCSRPFRHSPEADRALDIAAASAINLTTICAGDRGLATHSFPCSSQGVSALARVARHARLGKGRRPAEHQLWLLASGALNTAAAVCAHDGDAVSCFESIRTDSAVRGKFMQRIYAQHAMQDHVQNPDVCLSQETEDPDAVLIRLVSNLGPAQLFCAASALFVAIMASVILASESASASAARWLGLI